MIKWVILSYLVWVQFSDSLYNPCRSEKTHSIINLSQMFCLPFSVVVQYGRTFTGDVWLLDRLSELRATVRLAIDFPPLPKYTHTPSRRVWTGGGGAARERQVGRPDKCNAHLPRLVYFYDTCWSILFVLLGLVSLLFTFIWAFFFV